jgi:hypothetical protein
VLDVGVGDSEGCHGTSFAERRHFS